VSDGDILRDLANAKSPLQKAEEEIAYLKSIKTNNDTKDGITQAYWLGFLRWVRDVNTIHKSSHTSKGVYTGEGVDEFPFEKEVSEVNFWHWYIDNKLEDK
jgi:hypothetical protein